MTGRLFTSVAVVGALSLGACAAGARDARVPAVGLGAEPGSLPPPRDGGPAAVRRLTASEYRNCVGDLLGPGLVIPALEEDARLGGFSTTGAALVGTSVYAVERYGVAAGSLVGQVWGDPVRRRAVVGCEPGVDAGCARAFLRRFLDAAFRRAPTDEELGRYIRLADGPDPWRGLGRAVTAVLQSPKFLYRLELGRADTSNPERYAYGDDEIAARLSFFLWGSGPDATLRQAARRGELGDAEGVRRQVERLLASPRARAGMRNFFWELMRLSALDHLARELRTFTAMTLTLPASMQEETLRVLEDNFFDSQADARTLFTTRQTFVNAELGRLYGVTRPFEGADVDDSRFVPLRLPENSARVGLLGQAAFLAANAGTEETSPTARGKFVREVLLCEDVAPPPGNVDTNLSSGRPGTPSTLRQRLEEHRQDVGCARCHAKMDPLGFAFERFDAIGEYRVPTRVNPLDTKGALDGQPFEDAAALSRLLAHDDRVPACLVRNLYRYATGHVETPQEAPTLAAITKAFAASGYKLRDAVLALVVSAGFRYAMGSGAGPQ